MMSHYQSEALKILLSAVVRQNVNPEMWTWLNDKAAPTHNPHQFNVAFVSVPRRTGKPLIHVTPDQEESLRKEGAGLSVSSWSVDRLCRVWLLANADSADKAQYFQTIENLFLTAEVNELVALYSALPFLAYPQMWSKRCAEGIRSNIGNVLEAIMCNNPYPAAYLNEQAWNQLVLKAFFTEKPVEQIIGLDTRANAALAKTLSDYAHERWAAHRTVNPQIWRCTGKFIDKDIFPDMERLAQSENISDREAAALACSESDYPPAQELLNKLPGIKSAITSGELNWNVLAEKIKNHVLQQ
ncbi:EboA domain-containing protein [Agriterribacter sp.]|uniref:EboA domain-containing protein n=1 Tax=Agriterribacter sp. TaxID=2821509 RepID=UPI002C59C7C9|nr:EboA domain-containing protein [Agriterribacter sp.]HRP55954.1 EboA domain-containing protein [Agriterribacter sp.]